MLGRIKEVASESAEHFASWPNYASNEIHKVSTVLASGKVNYWTGEEGRLFEKEYAEVLGVKHAVALMNGTVALEAALAALNIGPGDEVITSCRTFIASASCIVLRGAKPVFADVDLVSQNITAESISRVITSKTRAIIVVHLAGWPCEMDAIAALAKVHNLYLIEDCAQAHGASYQDRNVGAWGDIAAFSFCQDKIITTGGEGGLIATNDDLLWEKVWSLKDHGKSYAAAMKKSNMPGFRWLHETFGTNWRMTEVQAAIGRLQLQKLNTWIKARQQNAAVLAHYFSHIPAFRLTIPPSHINHAYYRYYVFIVPEKLKIGWDRDRILQAIQAASLPCLSGSCSEIYLEKAFTQSDYASEQRLPQAKILGETSLAFLTHPTLTLENMAKIGQVVQRIMEVAMN